MGEEMLITCPACGQMVNEVRGRITTHDSTPPCRACCTASGSRVPKAPPKITKGQFTENRVPDPVLPFGKYQGQRASAVKDVRYLDWMLGLDNLNQPFRGELTRHLESRSDWQNLELEDE